MKRNLSHRKNIRLNLSCFKSKCTLPMRYIFILFKKKPKTTLSEY